MKINKYFKNRKELESEYNFFIRKRLLFERKDKNLVEAHLAKAEHNLNLFNKLDDEFKDWKIISLYYSLYHSCLALLANKDYSSKNHKATLIFLIKHYSQIEREDLDLIDDLQIKENDMKFYTELQSKRHDANYSTSIDFDIDLGDLYFRVLEFILKVKGIVFG